MLAIFQQGLKHVLRKHCNFIASSLEVVGRGSNEPVYSGLNEPVVHFAPHWLILPVMIKSAQNLHSNDKTLSPECVRPFPRAPPRKTRSANNKRRKCAILTDSPEKAAIEQHIMKQKKRGRPKAKQPIKQAKRRLSARNNKKRKQKDTKMDLSSDDDSSETYCFVCVAAYSDSRPNEKWIQCTACKEWAHEKCINILHSGSFICRNCDSDESDFDY